ncbi:RibD family protein [Deinococcus sp. QL22]|uniref:RibD family protein n=1 Tax=Deinococcus sp. QL22 TaxID=2939437 RepID=UPI00352FFA3A
MVRPEVLLTYAQSLDGSIAGPDRRPLLLSGKESMRWTHTLRSQHDAILIGVGTLIADDPLLSVRYVEGDHPQPVVLDSRLRFPEQARLWQHPSHRPWIVTTPSACAAAQRRLEDAGARVIRVILQCLRGGSVQCGAVLLKASR